MPSPPTPPPSPPRSATRPSTSSFAPTASGPTGCAPAASARSPWSPRRPSSAVSPTRPAPGASRLHRLVGDLLGDLLQGPVLGLRQAEGEEDDRGDAEARVEPEGALDRDRPGQGEEERAYEEVGLPVGHGRDRHRRASLLQREDLGDHQPEDRPEPDREGGDVDDQADQG